jgi:hypothetical protein
MLGIGVLAKMNSQELGVSGAVGGVSLRRTAWGELPGLLAGGLAEAAKIGSLADVTTLDVLVNTSCDRPCLHCYYLMRNGEAAGTVLTDAERNAAVQSAIEAGIERVAIIGKEPLLPGAAGAERSLSTLAHVAGLRSRGHLARTSLVTNGTHLPDSWERLRDTALTELHISFEAPDAAGHDAVRGAGSFDLAWASLELAVAKGVAERVVASATLHRHNVSSLSGILAWTARIGVRHFTVTPYVSRRGILPPLTVGDVLTFLTTELPHAAARLSTPDPVQVTFEIDLDVLHRHAALFAEAFPGPLFVDRVGTPFLRTSMGPLEVTMRVHLPAPLCWGAGLSHDGFYFDRHPIYWVVPGYETLAAGHVREDAMSELLAQHRRRNAAALPELARRLLSGGEDASHQAAGAPAAVFSSLD